MNDFYRFPHTPHIAWLGDGVPREDKVLSSHEVSEILVGSVLVEEKLDGANLGVSLSNDSKLRVQNRGQYLEEPFSGQFTRLTSWLGQHALKLLENLDHNMILFGEWCAARHSLNYEELPDWFVLFDVYDRSRQEFWSSARRNLLAGKIGLAVVPAVYEGTASIADLKDLLETSTSRYRSGPPEGIVVRKDSSDWCEARAKLVRAEFSQSIGEHWRSRTIQWNRLESQHGKKA